MDSGLIDLPQEKWGSGTGRQVILKGDFSKVEMAILQSFGIMRPPNLEWLDATEIKVPATADCPAQVMMIGFPNILHPGLFVDGGLTDGRYRENTAAATLDFDLSASLWGTEKFSQWYLIYALAGNADTAFTLKAMPFMRVKSQASQIISLGTLMTPATGIGYGLTTNALAGGLVYVLAGASRGLMRTISANNNDNTTGGTITYTGAALTLAAGDWFVVLPPAVNFRWLGDIFNKSGGDIVMFNQDGNKINFLEPVLISHIPFPGPSIVEDIRCASPLATSLGAIIGQTMSLGHPDGTNYTSVMAPNSQDYFAEFAIKNCRYKGVNLTEEAFSNKTIYFKYPG